MAVPDACLATLPVSIDIRRPPTSFSTFNVIIIYLPLLHPSFLPSDSVPYPTFLVDREEAARMCDSLRSGPAAATCLARPGSVLNRVDQIDIATRLARMSRAIPNAPGAQDFWGELTREGCLLAEPETSNDLLVSFPVSLCEIFEETRPLSDHHEQAATRGVILFVFLEV